MARGHWSRFFRLTRVAALSAFLAVPAGAATKHADGASKKVPKGCPAPKVEPPVAVVPVAGAKVAVLAFTGDEPKRSDVR